MIQIGLKLVPWIVSGGVFAMIAFDDIVFRAIFAIPVLAALAWQRIRLDL